MNFVIKNEVNELISLLNKIDEDNMVIEYDGKSFNCLYSVMSLSSPKIAELYLKRNCPRKIVIFSDIKLTIIQEIIDFCYGLYDIPLTTENVEQYYTIATILFIPKLLEYATPLMIFKREKEFVFNNLSDLSPRSIMFLATYFESFGQTESFSSMTVDNIRAIIRSPFLKCSATVVFDALLEVCKFLSPLDVLPLFKYINFDYLPRSSINVLFSMFDFEDRNLMEVIHDPFIIHPMKRVKEPLHPIVEELLMNYPSPVILDDTNNTEIHKHYPFIMSLCTRNSVSYDPETPVVRSTSGKNQKPIWIEILSSDESC